MRVLVYGDRGAAGDTALGWLMVLAEHTPIQATLLMAYDRVATGVTQLEGIVQFVRAQGGAVVVETADSARASSAIVSAARRQPYDLIIVPPSMRGGAHGLLRSSRLSAVVRNVGSAVLVAHPPAHPPQKILVCVGGGTHSEVDAEVAARVALPFQARVVVLHIVSQVPLEYSGLEDMRSHLAQFMASGSPSARQIERAMSVLEDLGVEHEMLIREGIVVDEIIDEIRTGAYDLLVIGAHERGGSLLQFFLEDLSDDLTHRSPIATLVVQGVEAWRGGPT